MEFDISWWLSAHHVLVRRAMEENILIPQSFIDDLKAGVYDGDLLALERAIERRRAKLFLPGDHVRHIARKGRTFGIGTFLKGRAKTGIVQFDDPRTEPKGDAWMDNDCIAVVKLRELVLLGRPKNEFKHPSAF